MCIILFSPHKNTKIFDHKSCFTYKASQLIKSPKKYVI